MEYQMEIKQIVDYPRCRIYREFIRSLMADKDLHINGSSYLFYYIILCSYANFRSSYQRMDGVSYLVCPGEWICKASELSEWFRTRFQHQAISILEHLQKQNYISYTKLGHGNLIKFKIMDWKKYNTALDYNYPCLKDDGFFFFPVSAVHELISVGRCSEIDVILDLWIHAIYNDEQVQGSDIGPVVYFRNYTGNPLISYSTLSLRWGISKSTVSRYLNKFQEKGYLSIINFTGRNGSIIYLCSYLSTMFNISDIMIDKEEVSMTFKIPVNITAENDPDTHIINKNQIDLSTIPECSSVSNDSSSVSKIHILYIVRKAAQILATQGVSCCECPLTQYKLSPLSDCREGIIRYSLRLGCPDMQTIYRFELTLSPEPTPDGYLIQTKKTTENKERG